MLKAGGFVLTQRSDQRGFASEVGTKTKRFFVRRNRRLGISNEIKDNMEAASGFEPLHRGFADLSLNHLGTPPCVDR